MRITILSTMLADRRGVGEWGFSALVDARDRRILFDAGGRPDVVLRNAQELGCDLAAVEDVVLSHGHWDHTGGLVPLRRALMGVRAAAVSRAHVAPGFFTPRTRGGKPFSFGRESRLEYEKLGGRFVEHEGLSQPWPGVWITGPIPRRHPECSLPRDIVAEWPDGPRPDEVLEDCALLVEDGDGIAVLTGCGHAGVVNTLEAARSAVGAAPIRAVVGGLHLFDADDARVDWTGAQLRAFGVEHVLGTHCTGIEPVFRLRASAGLDRRTCAVGAVGASYGSGVGIDPGTLAR